MSYAVKTERMKQMEKDSRCRICKKGLSDKHGSLSQATMDHIIPKCLGGTNDPSNLILVCASCNQSKGSQLPHEWIESIANALGVPLRPGLSATPHHRLAAMPVWF